MERLEGFREKTSRLREKHHACQGKNQSRCLLQLQVLLAFHYSHEYYMCLCQTPSSFSMPVINPGVVKAGKVCVCWDF